MEKEYDFMPEEFNPDNFHLSNLACHAAVAIDNHLIGRSEVDYSDLIKFGKIMYMLTEPQFTKYNSQYVSAREDSSISVFLYKFLKKATDKTPQTIDDVVSQTKELALSLIKMKEISRDEQIKLRDTCLLLSESLSAYWHEFNPTGFKRYCAA